jgi:hypothetical protein
MSADALGTALTAGAVWTAAAVAGHLAIFHMVQVEHRARTLTLLFAGAAVATLWTCLLLDVDRWRTLLGMSAVACAYLLYMPFYYTIAASQSVQLVIDIHAAPHGLSVEEIRARYPVDEILAGRLETLLWAGYVTAMDGRFTLTGKGRLTSRPFRAVKALWRLGPGG